MLAPDLNGKTFEQGKDTQISSLIEEIHLDAENLTGEKKLLDQLYFPSWDNKPEEKPPVITLGGVTILTHQNTTAIIAAPGVGKSSICESTLASFLNPSVDSLGIQVHKNLKGMIYCDFERTQIDTWNSFYRAAKRAMVPSGQDFNNVKIVGFRAIPRLQQRLEAIEILLQSNPCSLLILDGAGDLVSDSNDLLQAIECRIWIREITVKYNLSILTTLHPNPGTDKPRGHIGSEICREAECVLLAKHLDGDLRIITSDFDHGKNRNDSKLTTAYMWDIGQSMFLSANVPAELTSGTTISKKRLADAIEFPESVHINALKNTFKNQEHLNSSDFLAGFCSSWNNKEGGSMKISRAKVFRQYYLQEGFIETTKGKKANEVFNVLGGKCLVGQINTVG